MTAPEIDWAAHEADLAASSDAAVAARTLHPSNYSDRDDLTVVTRRPASETIRLADTLTIWIALRHPLDGLLAEVEGWSPQRWAAIARAADQPAPTPAVQAVVLGHIRLATAKEARS